VLQFAVVKATIEPLTKRPSLGQDITQQLLGLIQQGSFPPGETLPGQRELAQQFGTSVPSVREAISVLSAAGILEPTPGRGTVVAALGSAPAPFLGWLGVANLEDLWEARQMLEQHTIAAAAKRINADTQKRLEQDLAQMEAALADVDLFVNADLRFHLGIAEVAGNAVITRLMQVTQAPLKQHIRQNVERVWRLGLLPESLNDHRLLLQAMVQHKPKLAQSRYDQMLARAMQKEPNEP
jgi:GntR family transcriptional regulator, transcriptional repressor for pyruvate dehydrogenase complex